LLTWNCAKGRIDAKAPRLDPLAADIIVLQECARPDATSDRCLWFGDNLRIPRQAGPPFHACRAGIPRHAGLAFHGMPG
jgi:hypothetical protein